MTEYKKMHNGMIYDCLTEELGKVQNIVTACVNNIINSVSMMIKKKFCGRFFQMMILAVTGQWNPPYSLTTTKK